MMPADLMDMPVSMRAWCASPAVIMKDPMPCVAAVMISGNLSGGAERRSYPDAFMPSEVMPYWVTSSVLVRDFE